LALKPGVTFFDSENIANIVRKEWIKRTKFTEWMEANKKYPAARD
jgi:hypothetical protein